MAHSHPESLDAIVGDNLEAQQNPAPEEIPPVPCASRRDENSISFRHFLQQQTDVVASRHHIPRGTNPAAVDLVDITMALPDFVQDHLVVEAQVSESSQPGHSNQNSAAPLDLSAIHQVLPEFTSERGQDCSRRRLAEENRRGFEGGSPQPSSSSSQSQSTTLPDFLSDGPMNITCTEPESNSNNQSYGVPPISSGNLESRSEMNQRSHSVDADPQASHSQIYQIERLRRELAEKNRSITHLQNEVGRQRNEISLLQETLSLFLAERRNPSSSTTAFNAGGEPQELDKNTSDDQVERASPKLNGGSSLNGDGCNGLSTQVLQCVETSEALIRKLMQQINALRRAAIESENQQEN